MKAATKMKALIDTGVWFRHYHRLPITAKLADLLSDSDTEMHLSPLSVYEIAFKWQRQKLSPLVDSPDLWLDDALEGYNLVMPTAKDSMQAGLWTWTHGDPVDRLLAAMALSNNLTLIHTDEKLKDLDGFPQQYFRGTN